MLIFDNSGKEIKSPDLDLGHIDYKTRNIVHRWVVDVEEVTEKVVIAEYSNGGKDVEFRVVTPEEGHWETSLEDGTVIEFNGIIPDDMPKEQPISDVETYGLYRLYSEEELAKIDQIKKEEKDRILISDQMPLALSMFVMQADLPDEQALQVEVFYPEWTVGETYKIRDIRRYKDDIYRCLLDNNATAEHTPDISTALWKKILPPEEPGGYLPWVQPLGATDAYKKGERVIHKDKTWESAVDNNVWEPGVYGWTEV